MDRCRIDRIKQQIRNKREERLSCAPKGDGAYWERRAGSLEKQLSEALEELSCTRRGAAVNAKILKQQVLRFGCSAHTCAQIAEAHLDTQRTVQAPAPLWRQLSSCRRTTV